MNWILGFIICFSISACFNGLKFRDEQEYDYKAQYFIGDDWVDDDWKIGFYFLTAIGDFILTCALALIAVRQLWAFSRDNGFPLISKKLKHVNRLAKAPIGAGLFLCVMSCLLELFVFSPTTREAMFSLFISSNYLAFVIPTLLVILPCGRDKLNRISFHYGRVKSIILNIISVIWLTFIIVLSMFPRRLKLVFTSNFNYSVVTNLSFWLMSMLYFGAWGSRSYKVPEPHTSAQVAQDNIEL